MNSITRMPIGTPITLAAALLVTLGAEGDAPGGAPVGLLIALGGLYLAMRGAVANGVQLGLSESGRQ